MQRETLFDHKNSVIGYIVTDSNGKQTIQTRTLKVLGYYDPKSNKTMDCNLKIIGTGNLLTRLL